MSKDIEFCIEIKDTYAINFTPYHQQLMTETAIIWAENKRVPRTDPNHRYVTVESGFKGKDGSIQYILLHLSNCNVYMDSYKINQSRVLIQNIADELLKRGINYGYTMKMTDW